MSADVTGRAAPTATRIMRQALFEARVTLSNGEQLLVSLILPALILYGLQFTSVSAVNGVSRLDSSVPSVFALAILSSSLVGQAIGTAFDRRNGVLRLLATSPLGRGGWLAGKLASVVAIQILQLVVLGIEGLILGWRPPVLGLVECVPVLVLGSAAITSVALLIAGIIKAELVLAVANLLWAVSMALGVAIPLEKLPVGLKDLAMISPAGALASALRATLTGGALPWWTLITMMVWLGIGSWGTMKFFKWTS